MKRALAATLLLAAAPAGAQAPPRPAAIIQADPSVHARADDLLAFLQGTGGYDRLFGPDFRAQVPLDRFRSIAADLAGTIGQPLRIDAIAMPGRWQASVTIAYQRGSATMEVTVDPAEPHLITGLRITGQRLATDRPADLEAAIRALPGTAAVGLYALGTGQPRPVLEVGGDKEMPLGSAFKLWVLAEAVRQVNAGKRRWADVVPAGPPSLPSGILQSWPTGAPVTLQTLATLMISISDNTATDTLMRALGRPALNELAGSTGLSSPVLTTREAFVIKGDPALRRRWQTMAPAGRAALLARDKARFDVTPLATGIFADGPVATDTVEWFATPRATARLLDRLRLSRGETARAMLAINPGTTSADAARFAYIGFKGGAEPGVLTLNFLVRTRSGQWFALAGAWHRPDGATSEPAFLTLMSRALALVADR